MHTLPRGCWVDSIGLNQNGLHEKPGCCIYHQDMKTSYILGAILVCSVIGSLVGARSTKTALLVVTGVLSVYGLVRLLG